jgi:Na+-translocating ferredoxin:NAD+ oxidoreductase RnfG subunit
MKIKPILTISFILGALIAPSEQLYAKTYLTIDQAKKVLLSNVTMQKLDIVLAKEQMRSIKKASKVRVNNNKLDASKTSDNGWFIIDQVIGKHENIDIAVALNNQGKVTGVEVLQYRETYGGEVRNKKWLAQFLGKDSSEHLRLDHQIKNISGATLSSRHITDGINRLTHTWNQVLRFL